MSTPQTPETIIPAIKAALSGGVSLGRYPAKVDFNLGSVVFQLDVTPQAVTLVEGAAPAPSRITMSPSDFIGIVNGALDLHVRLTRKEIAITAPDQESELIAGGILVRLASLLGIEGPLRGTLVEELYTGMDFRTYRSSIPAPYGRKLYELTREIVPERTLEIGMAHALSTLCIAYALRDNGKGHHWACDPFQKRFRDGGLKNVARAGLSEIVTHLDQPDYLALPALVTAGTRFQLVFVDGCHFVDYTFLDVFYGDLLLDPGGLLVVDDVHLAEVDEVIAYLVDKRADSYEPLPALSTERIAVFRKKADDARVDLGLSLAQRRRV